VITYNDMRAELRKIEADKGVTVLFAVLSGSRAWNMHRKDSDYDVRFVYAHDEDYYLSIDEARRDTIERKVGDIELAGWDVRKALRLLRKSNASIIWWLHSPVIEGAETMVKWHMNLLPGCFNIKRLCFHYLNFNKNIINPDESKSSRYVLLHKCIVAYLFDHGRFPSVECWDFVVSNDVELVSEESVRDLPNKRTPDTKMFNEEFRRVLANLK